MNAGVSFLLVLATGAAAFGQGLLAVDPGPKTPERLKAMAAQFEQDGSKADAAEVYEELIRMEPSSRGVLAPRLVQIYIELRKPNEALTWAREVKDATPDPAAYLAGVYTQLGGYNEAESILAAEIGGAEDPSLRKTTLLWQLAELYAKQNREKERDDALARALKAAEGTPYEEAARKRVGRSGSL